MLSFVISDLNVVLQNFPPSSFSSTWYLICRGLYRGKGDQKGMPGLWLLTMLHCHLLRWLLPILASGFCTYSNCHSLSTYCYSKGCNSIKQPTLWGHFRPLVLSLSQHCKNLTVFPCFSGVTKTLSLYQDFIVFYNSKALRTHTLVNTESIFKNRACWHPRTSPAYFWISKLILGVLSIPLPVLK